MNYKTKGIISLLCAALAACSVAKDETKPVSNSNTQVTSAEQLVADEISVGQNRIGSIQKKNFDAKAIDLQKRKYIHSNLEPISVSPKLNASVYRMPTNENRSGMYVAPRLMVYGGKKLNSLVKTTDNQVLIPFNVAIIDGLREANQNLLSDFGNTKIPNDLQITDYSELKASIQKTTGYNKDFEIAALPGCLTKATVHVAGKAYDVTPEDVGSFDYCEMNKPFTVHLRASESMANYILSEGLNNGTVDLSIAYGIMAQVPVSQYTIIFERAKLIDELKARLSLSNPPYSKAFLETAIKSVLEESNLDIYVTGNLQKQAEDFVAKTMAEIFTSFAQVQNEQSLGECKEAVCFDFAKVGAKNQGNFSISWNQMQTERVEKSIRLISKLKPIDDTTKLIGTNNRVPLSNQIEFSNKPNNPETNPDNIYGTNFLPVKGSTFEITPTKLVWERRARPEEVQVAHHDFNDCTGRDWKGSCTYTFKTLRDMSFEYLGDDIWEEVQEVHAKLPNLYSMIYVQFTFTDARKLECRIDDLNGYSVENMRGFTIENSDNCQIFQKSTDKISSFALINKAKLDQQKYKSGIRRVASHEGGFDHYIETSYSPEIHLSLNLKLLGNGFISRVMTE